MNARTLAEVTAKYYENNMKVGGNLTRQIVIEGIFIANSPNTFVSTPITEAMLEFGGIRGDRHFGVTFPADARQPMYPRGTEILNKRQISILAQEEVEIIAEQLGIERLLPEWLGANLIISGLPNMTNLLIQTRLIFPSGAGLICEGENNPCIYAGEEVQKHYPNEKGLSQEFVRSALGRRGIVCSVERPGLIKQNDIIKLI